MSSIKKKEARAAYLFLAPSLVLFFVFVLVPLLTVIVLSFCKYDIINPPKFTGMNNYIKLAGDRSLAASATNTSVMALFSMIFIILIALLLAVLINNRMGRVTNYFLRLAYFFPVIVSPVYIALIWVEFLATDTGVINYFLNAVGLPSVAWLTEVKMATVTIIIVEVWRQVGFAMIIFIAGLKNIPVEYYEAASIDGANSLQVALRITIPLLTPTILFNMIITTISELKLFAIPNLMTEGGPVDSTRTVAMYLYQTAFLKFNMGYASTISVLFILVIFLLTALQMYFSKRWVQYT